MEVVAWGVEVVRDFLVVVGDEPYEEVGRDRDEDGDSRGGDIGVEEVEVIADAGADNAPKARGEAHGANKAEGELLVDGGGRSNHDVLNGGLGDNCDVMALATIGVPTSLTMPT